MKHQTCSSSCRKGLGGLAVAAAGAALLVLASCSSPVSSSTAATTAASLAPTAISYSGDAAVSGGTLSVTLTITNSGSSSVSTSFPVDFYLSTSKTFSPSTDGSAGSITVNQTIAGNSSINVTHTLSLPTLSLGSYEGIQTYLYAVLDPNNATGAAGSSGTTSTLAESASLALFAKSLTSYTIKIETYYPASPTTNPWTTGTTNPGVALYTASSGQLNLVTSPSPNYYSFTYGGQNYYNYITAAGLTSGTTYYVAVQSASSGSGPYAIQFLPSTTNITTPSFSNLSSAPSTANDTPTISVTSSTPPSTVSSVPSGAVELKIGSAKNWYLTISSGATDWFTFTLP